MFTDFILNLGFNNRIIHDTHDSVLVNPALNGMHLPGYDSRSECEEIQYNMVR
jgi:hypothetical protein